MNIFTVLLTQPLTNGLVLFYKILGGNMGVAIIGFSLFLRLALHPLTKKSMESMKKMKKYQIEINKLKEKHKGDRAKQMKAQSDFYKDKGINPSAGCLPQIVQLVILFSLFRVFINVLVPGPEMITNVNELLYEPLKFANSEIIQTKFLYLDVTTPDVFSIPGIPFPIPGPLIILAALAQFISAKIMQPYIAIEKKIAKKTPEKSDDTQVAIQSSMTYMFPLMTLFFGVRFPSGLALYWLLFSVFQAYQQYSSSGWGGATPWLNRLGLIELPNQNEKSRKKRGGISKKNS